MSKKKIAVFSTPWSNEHIGGILAGMQKKAIEAGIDVFIFNSYGGNEGGEDYNFGEYNIFELPDLDMFDGILIICNSVNAIERLQGVFDRIRQNGIPCICLDEEIEGFHYVGTDNYQAMFEMVEHLIIDHGCKTFNYVGGPSNHNENCLRKQGFRDALRKHGLAVEEERIRDYSFVKDNGSMAFEYFEKLGLATPDAVVCANDDMATGYVDALIDRGYRVPEDVRVTGFDFISYGQNYCPEIASVERSREDLGFEAVTHLLQLIDGKQIPMRIFATHHIRPNTSCGCQTRREDYVKIRRKKIEAERWVGTSRWNLNMILKNLLVCDSAEEFFGQLRGGLNSFRIDNFCIVINDTTYDKEYDFKDSGNKRVVGYPDNMRLYFNNRDIDLNARDAVWVSRSELIPKGFADETKDGHVYVLSSLHLRGVSFGYCIMENGIEHIIDGNWYYWLGMMNAALENTRQNVYIHKINDRLQRMYMLDAMTGTFNRFALGALGEPMLKKNRENNASTLFLFSDMDGLKIFNDTYGHDMGDAAIKHLANIMMQSCRKDGAFCVRYGGDEFLIMSDCESEEEAEQLKKNIEDRLNAFNDEQLLPTRLSTSIGYFLADGSDQESTMDSYITKADEMMYQMKKAKKALKKQREMEEQARLAAEAEKKNP